MRRLGGGSVGRHRSWTQGSQLRTKTRAAQKPARRTARDSLENMLHSSGAPIEPFIGGDEMKRKTSSTAEPVSSPRWWNRPVGEAHIDLVATVRTIRNAQAYRKLMDMLHASMYGNIQIAGGLCRLVHSWPASVWNAYR